MIIWVVRRRGIGSSGEGDVKGQKIAQNDKKLCLPHLISQEPYIIWSSFVVQKCKNYVCCTPCLSKHTSFYRGFCCTSLKWWHLQMFFSFSQNFGFPGSEEGGRTGGRVKGKKSPKMTKQVFLTRYLRNCTSYGCSIWYTCVKWWYLQEFFFYFFKIVIIPVFQSSSINTNKKFWGMPHLLHMWVIFFSVSSRR